MSEIEGLPIVKYPAIIIVEVKREIFEKLEANGEVNVVLMRQRVGEGARYFVNVKMPRGEKKTK